MKGLHGIIFAYESHNNLRELTEHRMPASVPFAGRYRIIDFILSSMVNAGITDGGNDVTNIVHTLHGCTTGEDISLSGIVGNDDLAAVHSDVCVLSGSPSSA